MFLAYGGWSDAATLSAEMRDARRGITRALITGMSIVTALYLLANWAYLRGLGLAGVAASQAPAADLMLRAFGPAGRALIVAVVAVTAITSMNAILIAGARTTYAAARDTGGLGALGEWHVVRGTPAWAIVAISTLALLLVGLGTWTRSGFATMVDFLSPVYWFFLTLSGAALIVLRRRFPDAPRPFRVPGYPWTGDRVHGVQRVHGLRERRLRPDRDDRRDRNTAGGTGAARGSGATRDPPATLRDPARTFPRGVGWTVR